MTTQQDRKVPAREVWAARMSVPFRSVRQVASLLDRAYPPSRLGNKHNPFDELIYILLSLQTNEARYQEVHLSFKKRFPRAGDLLGASEKDIAAAIMEGGLAAQKARHIKAIATRLCVDFGKVSLQHLKEMPTKPAEEYLCSLPGVGIKTARCVLMYSLDRNVFPADAHCLRVMDKLGWIRWRGERAEKFADAAQAGVPPALRAKLHIRLVQHGRAVCLKDPRCRNCVVKHLCPTGQRLLGSGSAGGGGP